MSISGNLEDVSGADVMQFIHLGRRTGTLRLEQGERSALIGFHCGKLVSARAPDQPMVGDLLVDRGLIDRSTLEEAIDRQRSATQHRTLGQILVAGGDLDAGALREVVVDQIRRTISEVVQWESGQFEFAIDDLRPVDDIALYPGDVVPDADLNTQMVLLEAARIFDERNRGGPGSVERRELLLPSLAATPAPAPAVSNEPAGAEIADLDATDVLVLPRPGRKRREDSEVQVLSTDRAFVSQLREACLRLSLPVHRVGPKEIGAEAGDPPPMVVVDLRPPAGDPSALRRICRIHQRLPVIALIADGTPLADAYEAGAVAALPADGAAVAACLGNLIASRRQAKRNGRRPRHEVQSTVARLRRVFGDLRSGLISATVALNLMHIISESVERAVLFLVRHDGLTALGAFGETADGRPLAELTRNLRVGLDEDNALTRCREQEEALAFGFEEADLPPRLAEIVGRPASDQVVIFPVLGTRRVIAMVYSDNGSHPEPIADIEILELATAQVGMAFENELLRHQISKNGG